MAIVRGCLLPDDLYYHIEHNIWVMQDVNGNAILGMTSYACSLSGELVSLTPKKVGKAVKRDRSCATVESGKWVGPVKTPIAGEIVSVNDIVVNDPSVVSKDPYGDGWVAVIKPDDWLNDSTQLLKGNGAFNAFEKKMDQDGFGGC